MSVKISELPILDSLADNDVIAGVDTSANVTSKIEMATLKNYIDTNTQYTAGTNINITDNVISAPFVYDKTQTTALIENLTDETNALIDNLKDETDAQIEELQSEVDSLSTIFNAFPTESGEGESLTLDDTAEVKFKKFDLKGNTSQFTTTGKNLLKNTLLTTATTTTGVTATPNSDGSVTLNGTATATTYFNLSQYDYGSTSFSSSYGGSTDYIASIGVTQTGVALGFNGSNKYTALSINNGVTVNNLKVYPMIRPYSVSDDTYEPYTNGASPNPDYPQEVHVVSGDNEINICGKNLLNANFSSNTINGVTQIGVNNVITLNGANNKAHSFDFPNTITYEPNTTYTIHVKIIGGSFTPYKQDSNWAIQLYNLNGVSNITLTSNDYNSVFQYSFNKKTTTKPRIWFGWEGTSRQGTDGVFNNLQIQIMVVKGAYSLSNYPTFEPYDGNIYDINLLVENKFDDNTTTNILITDDGTEQANNAIKTSTYIKVEPNTLYTCSSKLLPDKTSGWLKFSYYDASKNYLSYLYTDNTIRTITTPNNCGYIRIGYHTSVVNDVQFEKGSKQNTFTPYGTTPIELCKIGNYQDYFYKDNGNWYKYEVIKKLVLNGTETGWAIGSTRNNYKYFELTISQNTNNGYGAKGNFYCNIAKEISTASMFEISTEQDLFSTYNNKLRLLFVGVNTTSAFQTLLASTNAIVYYTLATPITTQITDTTLISQLNAIEQAQSKENQTNISQVNNDKPFILDVTAIKSLQNVLDRIELLES